MIKIWAKRTDKKSPNIFFTLSLLEGNCRLLFSRECFTRSDIHFESIIWNRISWGMGLHGKIKIKIIWPLSKFFKIFFHVRFLLKEENYGVPMLVILDFIWNHCEKKAKNTFQYNPIENREKIIMMIIDFDKERIVTDLLTPQNFLALS